MRRDPEPVDLVHTEIPLLAQAVAVIVWLALVIEFVRIVAVLR